MQTNPFYKNVPNSPQLETRNKNNSQLPLIDEEEYSNNVLNIGFIAEDSKLNLSDSSSVYSDHFSISAISAVQGNPKDSPQFFS